MSHWYDQEGNLVATVKRSDGRGTRDTTIRDARKLGLVPSVTTIIDSVSKPGLERWKQDQLLEVILKTKRLTKPKLSDAASVKTWKNKLIHKSTEITKQAADNGVFIHDLIEKYLAGTIQPDDYCRNNHFTLTGLEQILKATVRCLESADLLTNTAVAERSFATPAYGGKVDYSCTSGFVLDFKTKSVDCLTDVTLTDEYRMQLAAYRRGFYLLSPTFPRDARCYNLFISTTCPGSVRLVSYSLKEMERAEAMFWSLVDYWWHKNRQDWVI